MRFLILLLLISTQCFSQEKIDTVINEGIYKSYFSYELRQPVFVSYVLYMGGGNCDRKSFKFKKLEGIPSAGNEEYKGSGYDRGHLANAEDFAFDCEKDELTFRYYNCLPQTPNLNRGKWKVWEEHTRDLSREDSLLVICGGVWKGKYQGNLAIPVQCWKVVKSLRTGEVKYVLLFENSASSVVKRITLQELERVLKRKLPQSF